MAIALLAAPAAHAGSPPESLANAVRITEVLAPVIVELLAVIELLTPYRSPPALPEVYQLPRAQLEALVCDEPCSVFAAYLPGEGIVLSEQLDPARELRDRAALLHELVHALQQGHPRFAQMASCERERAKEQEAYDAQNAYLARSGSAVRVVFYDGEFDCGDDVPSLVP